MATAVTGWTLIRGRQRGLAQIGVRGFRLFDGDTRDDESGVFGAVENGFSDGSDDDFVEHAVAV